MPKASVEDVVAEISNLAREIKFFDLLTYIFAMRALELELLRESEKMDLERVQKILNITRHIDSTVVNSIRQLYPFLLALEAKEGVQVGEQVLKVITGIERVQAELDMLILEEAAKGRVDEVYEELLKMLIKSMLTTPTRQDPP